MKKSVVWIDDDINRFLLRPYIDEFEEKSFEIIKVMKADDVVSVLDDIDDDSLAAIIIDISMASYNLRETNGGLKTGLIILKKLLEDTRFENIPKVVFTNVDDEEIEMYCDEIKVPYLKKEDYFSDEFVKKLESIIINSK